MGHREAFPEYICAGYQHPGDTEWCHDPLVRFVASFH